MDLIKTVVFNHNNIRCFNVSIRIVETIVQHGHMEVSLHANTSGRKIINYSY